MTPCQRKVEAVKENLTMNWSLYHWIVRKKRMVGTRRRSQRLITLKKHNLPIKKMCQKAMDTMNNVNDVLTKVNTYLDKAQK